MSSLRSLGLSNTAPMLMRPPKTSSDRGVSIFRMSTVPSSMPTNTPSRISRRHRPMETLTKSPDRRFQNIIVHLTMLFAQNISICSGTLLAPVPIIKRSSVIERACAVQASASASAMNKSFLSFNIAPSHDSRLGHMWILFRTCRPHCSNFLFGTCANSFEVFTGLVETYTICPPHIVRIIVLNGVIFPVTDWTDVPSPRRWFLQGKKSTTRAWITNLRRHISDSSNRVIPAPDEDRRLNFRVYTLRPAPPST